MWQEAQEPVEMSWIWRMGMTSLGASTSTSEEVAVKATNESLRVEWAKVQAWAHQWTEEVDATRVLIRFTMSNSPNASPVPAVALATSSHHRFDPGLRSFLRRPG